MMCDRCGQRMSAFITSMFNTDTICFSCKEKEEQHPLYEEARSAEAAAVALGDYNFPGIGKPSDL